MNTKLRLSFNIFISRSTADVYLFVRSKCTQESKNLRVVNMNSKIFFIFAEMSNIIIYIFFKSHVSRFKLLRVDTKYQLINSQINITLLWFPAFELCSESYLHSELKILNFFFQSNWNASWEITVFISESVSIDDHLWCVTWLYHQI